MLYSTVSLTIATLNQDSHHVSVQPTLVGLTGQFEPYVLHLTGNKSYLLNDFYNFKLLIIIIF